jgi:hypothetical protein
VRCSAIALVFFAVAGCKASSQLGEECALVKRDPNVDGGRLFITNSEIKAGAMKDFISFGSIDCDDLICVRDSDYAPADGGALNPTETAKGYCSRSCIVGDPCPSSSAEQDSNPRTRLTCRPLLLDAETLRALCNGSEEDRAKCKAYFGSTTSPDFCARGGFRPDAGF